MQVNIWIGSIAMRFIVDHPARKAAFMEFMRDAAADLIEELTGQRPSWPHQPEAAPERVSKIASRLLPALGVGAAIGQALRAGWVETTLVGGVAAAGVAVFGALYRRRGPDRTPCTVCPERLLSPCSGFLPIVRRSNRAISR